MDESSQHGLFDAVLITVIAMYILTNALSLLIALTSYEGKKKYI